MIVKFLLLYISILLFFSCASQGIAMGGPADTEGPILISVQPPNETLEILPDQKIILLFNELLDPVSIPAAITLAEEGSDVMVLFVVQRQDAEYFQPHWERDPKFGSALFEAWQNGLQVRVIKMKMSTEAFFYLGEIPYQLNPGRS